MSDFPIQGFEIEIFFTQGFGVFISRISPKGLRSSSQSFPLKGLRLSSQFFPTQGFEVKIAYFTIEGFKIFISTLSCTDFS